MFISTKAGVGALRSKLFTEDCFHNGILWYIASRIGIEICLMKQKTTPVLCMFKKVERDTLYYRKFNSFAIKVLRRSYRAVLINFQIAETKSLFPISSTSVLSHHKSFNNKESCLSGSTK